MTAQSRAKAAAVAEWRGVVAGMEATRTAWTSEQIERARAGLLRAERDALLDALTSLVEHTEYVGAALQNASAVLALFDRAIAAEVSRG